MPRVWLSLGSNIDRERNIRGALESLCQLLGPLVVSTVYESVAVGFDGDAFYNLVVGGETELGVADLARQLREIETLHGRERSNGSFAPRTLDIDLLTYGDLKTDQPLQLPRDEITRYAFVLLPLSEVAGDELHPELGVDYATLWKQAGLEDQELWPIEFDASEFQENSVTL